MIIQGSLYEKDERKPYNINLSNFHCARACEPTEAGHVFVCGALRDLNVKCIDTCDTSPFIRRFVLCPGVRRSEE